MTPLLWRRGVPCELSSLRIGDGPVGIDGHFAGLSEHWWVRDAMGVHKLFVAFRDGEIYANQFAIDLIREGFSLHEVWSVPSGSALSVARGWLTRIPFGAPLEIPEVERWQDATERIQTSLMQTFERLKACVAGRPVYVTLSGGLDSSGIAALAAEYFDDVRAMTFAMSRDGESGDLRSARLVAEHLGIALEVIQVGEEELLAGLDRAIVDGQDHRDFNLHCALVNQSLAAAIAARAPGAFVLTGDGMNELMCDYEAVEYAGRTFYALPRLAPGALRRVLVRGLDAGDREVGVFSRLGLHTVQPYLLCASAYLCLPESFLLESDHKSSLARAVFGERIPDSVYRRPKVRAQVASEDGVRGTLAVVADAGFTGPTLMSRAASLYGCEEKELGRWIRGGMYRFPTRFDPSGGFA